ncbi:hypothetical protein EON67_06875 [archaeon]|nr:MAG: hypothetical protein EON67_06875 [archaeon]
MLVARVVAGVCPSDRAWFDVPTDVDTAHALAECSNAGLCNRATGKCRCFSGYEGEACQRRMCARLGSMGTPLCVHAPRRRRTIPCPLRSVRCVLNAILPACALQSRVRAARIRALVMGVA